MTITAELREAVRRAGEEPLRLEDPDSRSSYVLLRAEVYERMRARLEDEERDRLETDALLRRSKRNRQAMIADDRE